MIKGVKCLYMIYIVFAAALTIALEGWIYNFLKPWSLKLFLITMLMNAILNSAMNLILINLIDASYYYYFLALFEVLTVIIETLVLFLIFKEGLLRTFLFSLMANLISFSFGGFIIQFIKDEKGAIIGSIIFVVIAGILFGISLFLAGRSHYRNNTHNRKRNKSDEDSGSDNTSNYG